MPTPVVTISNRTATSFLLNVTDLTPDGVECFGSFTNGVITRQSTGEVLVANTPALDGNSSLTVTVVTGSAENEFIDLTYDTSTGQLECYVKSFRSTLYVPPVATSRFKTIFSKITRGLSYNSVKSTRRKFPTI
jgi:hypothetical protein